MEIIIILAILALAAGAAAWVGHRYKQTAPTQDDVWAQAPYKMETPVVETEGESAPVKKPRKPRTVKAAPEPTPVKKPARVTKTKVAAAKVKAPAAKKVKAPSKKV
jgi:uncharacterized iron-regulated membrane protein